MSMSSADEPSVMTDFALDYDVAFWADPVTGEGKPEMFPFIADSGSSRHVKQMVRITGALTLQFEDKALSAYPAMRT